MELIIIRFRALHCTFLFYNSIPLYFLSNIAYFWGDVYDTENMVQKNIEKMVDTMRKCPTFSPVPSLFSFSVNFTPYIQRASASLTSQRLLQFFLIWQLHFSTLKKSTLMKYNLHIIKCTNLNYATLTDAYTHVTLSTIKI